MLRCRPYLHAEAPLASQDFAKFRPAPDGNVLPKKVSSVSPFSGTDLRQIEGISQVDLPAWVEACLSVRGPYCAVDRFRESSGIEASTAMAIASARRVLQIESTSMSSTRPVRWLSQNDERLLGYIAAPLPTSAPVTPE